MSACSRTSIEYLERSRSISLCSFLNSGIPIWGRFKREAAETFSFMTEVLISPNAMFTCSGLTFNVFSSSISFERLFFLVKTFSNRLSFANPILCPISVSRMSALSCLKSILYSALEVNIR